MEETASWKGHSFTLLIFGGIVVLCSIFFVLGMLVGRTQGQRIAEMAFADTHSRAQVRAPEEEFTLDYDLETKDEKPDVKLQPAPPPPPPAESSEPKAPVAKTPAPSRTAAASSSKAPKPAPEVKETYLQVFSTNSQKQANSELKRVQSKGFKAKVVKFTKNNVLYHRVIVGPYKDSELDLARADLKAKGFKDVIIHK